LAVGGGAAVLLVIAGPLWNEFRVPGNTAWNAILGIFLIGLSGAALLLGRHFYAHSNEIGEARFDTHNEVDR
jgi:hypothetical protein